MAVRLHRQRLGKVRFPAGETGFSSLAGWTSAPGRCCASAVPGGNLVRHGSLLRPEDRTPRWASTVPMQQRDSRPCGLGSMRVGLSCESRVEKGTLRSGGHWVHRARETTQVSGKHPKKKARVTGAAQRECSVQSGMDCCAALGSVGPPHPPLLPASLGSQSKGGKTCG